MEPKPPTYEEVAKLVEQNSGDFEPPRHDPLLPAWFITRMTSDRWSFGLLTANNTIIGISGIHNIIRDVQGELWLDVELLSADDMWLQFLQKKYPGAFVLGAPVKRLNATIKASHIVAAFELADT